MSMRTDLVQKTEQKEWADTRVSVMPGFKAYVLPGAMYGMCVALMAEAGFSRADTVEEADVVVFIGGADVSPDLYNQRKLPCTGNDPERDKRELEIFNACKERGQVMFGICRGAQFLHVANGGQLWQDVNNHAGTDHWIYDIEEDVIIPANSYHHQMIALSQGSDLEVLAVCRDQIGTRFKSDSMVIDLEKEGTNCAVEIEIEAGYYNKSRCFFVQGHPECGTQEFKSWTMNKLKDLYLEWEDEDRINDLDKDDTPIEDQVAIWKSSALM